MDSTKKKMEKLANETADAETGIVYSEEIKAANEAEAEKFEGANVEFGSPISTVAGLGGTCSPAENELEATIPAVPASHRGQTL